ncbi:13180_t:CDS:1, partial [Gigaspora margarita]
NDDTNSKSLPSTMAIPIAKSKDARINGTNYLEDYTNNTIYHLQRVIQNCM